jgi:predicted nucleotidyltransferase component of viral defense system
MIKEWIATYNPRTEGEVEQAMREIMQEIALAGLQRAGFFELAAFYGGTALRIFHQLDRFSEDLDFSLLTPDPDFSLSPYLEGMKKEFVALGIDVGVQSKKKTKTSNVDSAFLKSDTSWQEITLRSIVPQEKMTGLRASIKIKLEVDKKPPPGFSTEEKLLLQPFSFYTKCYVLPDLFAGKMHALLFRKWGTRVKGRDWYDFEWYVRSRVSLHLEHLALRANDSSDWPKKKMSKQEFKDLLLAKIAAVNLERVRDDVEPFIRDHHKLSIWSKEYFNDLVQKILFLD